MTAFFTREEEVEMLEAAAEKVAGEFILKCCRGSYFRSVTHFLFCTGNKVKVIHELTKSSIATDPSGKI